MVLQVDRSTGMLSASGCVSLYWLGLCVVIGIYLDGLFFYILVVPQRVQVKLFCSVTVYEARTRSEIATSQNKVALRSMFELAVTLPPASRSLYFGSTAPA